MSVVLVIPPSRVKNHVLNANLNKGFNEIIAAIKGQYKTYIRTKKIKEYEPYTNFKSKYSAYDEHKKEQAKLKRLISKYEHQLNPDPSKKVIVINGKSAKVLSPSEIEPTKAKLAEAKRGLEQLDALVKTETETLNELLGKDHVIAALFKLDTTRSKKYRMSDEARVALAAVIDCIVKDLLTFAYEQYADEKLTLEHFVSDKIRDHPLSQFITYSEKYRTLALFAQFDSDTKKKVKSVQRAKDREDIDERKKKREQIAKLKESKSEDIPEHLLIKQDTMSFGKFVRDILAQIKQNNVNVIGRKIGKDVVELISDSIIEFLQAFAYIARDYLNQHDVKTISADVVYFVIGTYINTRRSFLGNKDALSYVRAYAEKYAAAYEVVLKEENARRKLKKKEKNKSVDISIVVGGSNGN